MPGTCSPSRTPCSSRPPIRQAGTRTSLRTVGLLSNLSVDKGVWDFVRILESAAEEGLDIRGRLAGPFDDPATERRVLERLGRLPNATYDGPLYGAAKSRFFEDIDLFLFPTRYDNETEGLVNLEALRAGVPVIAYGRGCIPEIVDADCGLVVPPADAFVQAALVHIRDWRRASGRASGFFPGAPPCSFAGSSPAVRSTGAITSMRSRCGRPAATATVAVPAD